MRPFRIVVRRLLLLVPVLVGISLVTFALTRVLPGSPIEQLAGPMSTREQRQALLEFYGLDRPLWIQYLGYIGGVARGDFGVSFVTSQPVVRDLRAYFPATLELTTCAILLAALTGIPLGVLGAVRRNSSLDHLTRVVAVMGVAVPPFWLGLVLIYMFFLQWQLVPPPLGRLPLNIPPPPVITDLMLVDALLAWDLAAFRASLHQLVLPVVVLGFGALAPLARMARASMLDVLDSPYVRASRALGVPFRRVVWKYALKNALLPVLTMLAIVYGYLLGGSVLVESIFSWPGLGRYAFNAIAANDYPAVQGFILYTSVVYVMVFLVLDVTYALLDPRIEA